jgi:hypothetical protein
MYFGCNVCVLYCIIHVFASAVFIDFSFFIHYSFIHSFIIHLLFIYSFPYLFIFHLFIYSFTVLSLTDHPRAGGERPLPAAPAAVRAHPGMRRSATATATATLTLIVLLIFLLYFINELLFIYYYDIHDLFILHIVLIVFSDVLFTVLFTGLLYFLLYFYCIFYYRPKVPEIWLKPTNLCQVLLLLIYCYY